MRGEVERDVGAVGLLGRGVDGRGCFVTCSRGYDDMMMRMGLGE